MKQQHIQSILIFSLLILSLGSMIGMQSAAALTAATFTTQATVSSTGTGHWDVVQKNATGNIVYLIDGGSGESNFNKVNLTDYSTSNVAKPLYSQTNTNPSAANATSTAIEKQFTIGTTGGSTQQLATAATTFVAEYAATSSSDLIGKEVNSITLSIKKTGAPTGTAIIGIFDSSGNTLLQFGTQNVALLTTSFVSTTFTNTAATRTIQEGDRIGAFFNAGTSPTATFDVQYQNANVYDGTANSFVQTATGAQGAAAWSSQTGRELMIVSLEYNYLASLTLDGSTTTEWMNGGLVFAGSPGSGSGTVSSNFDSARSLRSGLDTFAGEKINGGTIFSGDSVDTLEVRLAKTGSPTGTLTAGVFSGGLTNHMLVETGTPVDSTFTFANEAIAEHVNGGSALIGDTVNSMTVGMKKTGSPTGTATACVMNAAATCLYTFGTIDVSTLTTGYASKVFTNTASSHVIASGEYVGVKYTGSVDTTNTVSLASATTNQFDTTLTAKAFFAITLVVNQASGTAGNCGISSDVLEACAEKITGTSALVGQTVDTMTISLVKLAGSPTGTATACVMNSAKTCIYTFGTLDIASQLTASYQIFTFQNLGATHTISSGEYIGVTAPLNSAVDTVSTTSSSTDVYDSTNSIRSHWSSGAWVDTSTSDLGSATANRFWRLDCENCTDAWQADTTTDLGSGNSNQEFRLDNIAVPTVLHTFGTIAADSLTTTATVYSFRSGSDYSLSASEYFGVKFEGGSVGNTVDVSFSTTGVLEGSTSHFSYYDSSGGTTWNEQTTQEFTFRLYDIDREPSTAYFRIDTGGSNDQGAISITKPDATKIPATITHQSSTDGSTWTTRKVYTLTQATGTEYLQFDDVITDRYSRFNITSWGSAELWQISEIGVHLAAMGSLVFSSVESNGYVGFMSNSHGSDATDFVWGIADADTGEVIESTNYDEGLQNGWCICLAMSPTTLYSFGWNTGDHDLGGMKGTRGTLSGTSVSTNDIKSEGATTSLFAGGGGIEFRNVGGSEEVYLFYHQPGVTTVAIARWTGSGSAVAVTTIATSGAPATGSFDPVSLSGKLIFRFSDGGTIETYELDTATNGLTTLYTSGHDWLTFATQTYDQSPSGRTLKSTCEAYFASTEDADCYTPSTGAGTVNAFFFVETVNSLTGTLTGWDDPKYYKLSDTQILTSASAASTTWTVKSISGVSLTPTPWSEDLNVPLVQNFTVPELDVVKLICSAVFDYEEAYMKLGDDSDCAGWRVLATSSATVGREIDNPYSRTADLVHAPVFTAYSFTLTANNPDEYFLTSSYDGKKVDGEESDLSGQLQQRYVYGQCYDVTIENELTGEDATVGEVCANDFFTKTIRVQDLTIGDIPEGDTWFRDWQRDNTVASANFVTFRLDNINRPWNASIYIADHWNPNYRTISVWNNVTNSNGLYTLIINSALVGQPITSNTTLYLSVYDQFDNQVDPIVIPGTQIDLGNPFASLGNFAGLPLGIMAIVFVAFLWTKQDAYIGIIITAVVAALMMMLNMIPISITDASFWGAIFVFVTLGVFGAKKVFG